MKVYFMVMVAVVFVIGCSGENRTVHPEEDADQVSDEAGEEVTDEASDEAGDEVTDESSDEGGDEVTDESSDEGGDDVTDDISDEVSDEVEDEDVVEDSGIRMSTSTYGGISGWTNVLKDGKLYSWKLDVNLAIPVEIDLQGVEEPDILDVSTGDRGWACVLMKTGGAVYCWYASEAKIITPINVLESSDYSSIYAAGPTNYGYQCGKTDGGRLDCWGADYGLIDDDPETKLFTVPVNKAEGVKDVIIRGESITALTEDGTLLLWGAGTFEEISTPDGNKADRLIHVYPDMHELEYVDTNEGYVSFTTGASPYVSGVCPAPSPFVIIETDGGVADATGHIYMLAIESSSDYVLIPGNSDGVIDRIGKGGRCKSLVDRSVWCSNTEGKYSKVL